MNIRRLFAIGALILMGGILAACGTDDEEVDPTAVAPLTSDEVEEIEPTATDEATDEVTEDDATPAVSPVASPAASPVASPAATPVQEEATAVASPEATPEIEEADAIVPAVTAEEEASPVSAEEEEAEAPMVELSGMLTLDGRVQQDYTLSAEGCVGLGEWRQLAPGTQVIVRDASGTVVDFAQLEGQESDDTCAWTFAVEAPAADFFSISIPMVTEVWFDQNDPAVQSGELELIVP